MLTFSPLMFNLACRFLLIGIAKFAPTPSVPICKPTKLKDVAGCSTGVTGTAAGITFLPALAVVAIVATVIVESRSFFINFPPCNRCELVL